jgi:hypothetical protein
MQDRSNASGTMPSSRKPEATVQDVLRPCSPALREVAESLRKVLREVVPTATEHPYVGWKGIGYRDPQAGYFAGIFPQHDHVRLLFEHGAALDDPDGVFEAGTGVRQVRWIVLRPGKRLPRRAIDAMLRRALVHGSTRRRGRTRARRPAPR